MTTLFFDLGKKYAERLSSSGRCLLRRGSLAALSRSGSSRGSLSALSRSGSSRGSSSALSRSGSSTGNSSALSRLGSSRGSSSALSRSGSSRGSLSAQSRSGSYRGSLPAQSRSGSSSSSEGGLLVHLTARKNRNKFFIVCFLKTSGVKLYLYLRAKKAHATQFVNTQHMHGGSCFQKYGCVWLRHDYCTLQTLLKSILYFLGQFVEIYVSCFSSYATSPGDASTIGFGQVQKIFGITFSPLEHLNGCPDAIWGVSEIHPFLAEMNRQHVCVINPYTSAHDG